MKQVLLFFFVLLTGFGIHAQNHVFVLVDVSKSVSQSQLNNAKQALNEVLTGSNLTSAFVAQGTPQDLINFKLGVGDKISLSKFGSLNTTLAINPSLLQISNLTADVSQALNSIIWTPTDNQTYITLAKAKIAEFAKKQSISDYKLYIISDNIQDDFGPGGIPNYSDNYIRNLAEGYNTSGNSVSEAGYTKIKFNGSSLFTLSFSPKVDVSQYSLPGSSTVSPSPITNTPSNLKIELSSLKGGTNAKPTEIKTDKFTVSWVCKGAPSDAQYKITLSPVNNPSEKSQKFTTSNNSYSVANLASGKWRVTVSSAQPNFVASSASTITSVSSNGSKGFLWFALILAALGGGYWYWNKKRNEKIETTQQTNDVFSSDGNDNSPSEYF